MCGGVLTGPPASVVVSRFHPKVQGRALDMAVPPRPGRGRGGRGARVQSDDPFDFDTIETSKGPAQAEPADEEIADEENGEATPSTKEAMRSPAKPRFTVSMHSKRRWGILVDEKAEPQPQRAPMSRRCFMLLIFTGCLTLFGGIGLLVAARTAMVVGNN